MDRKERAQHHLKALQQQSTTMRLAAEQWNEPWQTLIATSLSARTRDEVTIVVAHKLFTIYPTIDQLAKALPNDVAAIIRPVNFYKNKTKNVLGCAQGLLTTFHGKVPLTCEELMTLPGVGRKTANVFLSESGHQAIGIDTHCAYIAKKLGWTKHTNPNKIEDDLKKLFPQHQWGVVNPIMVRFGKTHMSRKKKDILLKAIKKIK